MRNLREGFPGSLACPYWCFEVKLQNVPDSNCVLGGDLPWSDYTQTIHYMAWQPGLHYINQDLSVRGTALSDSWSLAGSLGSTSCNLGQTHGLCAACADL